MLPRRKEDGMLISPGQGLALTRMGFGLYFLSSAWDKTTNRNWLTGADGRQRPVVQGR
jgi:hypothetical protein